DVLAVAGDAAVRHLVVPYYREAGPPVVCWDVHGSYDLPADRAVHVREELPLRRTLDTLARYYPDLKSVLVLSDGSTTERQRRPHLDTLFAEAGLRPMYASAGTLTEWETQFAAGGDNFDLIYLSGHDHLKDWSDTATRDYVRQHLRRPVITNDVRLLSCAVLGIARPPAARHERIVGVVRRLLEGAAPEAVTPESGAEAEIWINQDLAGQIDFRPSEALLTNSRPVEAMP
ncbi:MAG: hypothetical protein WBA12_07930, partial [Catalinimonas sp.]